jgi:hypothetical protein
MRRSLLLSIVRAAVTVPATCFMILFNRTTKVDADCWTGCNVTCSGGNHCNAECVKTGGMGSNECLPMNGDSGAAQCYFLDGNCFS